MILVKDLKFSYKSKEILKGITFEIKSNEILSILGANGSGKSTLLKSMLGFLAFNGEILVDKKHIKSYTKKELARLIAYIPQSSNPAYEYSVFDVVLMGALHKGSIFSSFSKRDEILATRNLEKLGILHLKNEAYTKISGGERQLTYIARALTQEAKIIFMDEPTNGLDFGNQIKLLEMIKGLKNEGKTIVLTTHHPRHAKFVSDRVLFLKNGVIFKIGSKDEAVRTENIDEIYGIKYENFKDDL